MKLAIINTLSFYSLKTHLVHSDYILQMQNSMSQLRDWGIFGMQFVAQSDS